METNKSQSNNNIQPNGGIVLACSGASDLGELTDKVARKLRDNKTYNMKCLAMVAADDKALIETLQTTDALVIDGCPVDCGKKIMEEAWLSNYRYIRLTDFGYEKGKTPVTDKIINKIYDRIINSKEDNRIIHNRPVTTDCCSIEDCDMFDFMSDYVGLKILHPGGIAATYELLELLNLDKNKKVLDIACGKGRTSVYIAKKYGCQVVGIEILEKSIEQAKNYAKKNGVEHLVSFQVADAHNLPFSDDEFDVTVAQAMLILVKDKVKVVEEATRVLKPYGRSGWLELSWKKEPTQEFLDVATKEICAACIAKVVTFQGWEELFRQGGIKEISTNKHDMNYGNMLGMIEDEGVVNGLKIMFKYLTNSKIRKRMMKLDNFFKSHPEYIGYGIYLGKK